MSSGILLVEQPFQKCAVKTCSLIVVVAVFVVFTRLASATQADDTTITITGRTAGATPFISKLTLDVSNTTVLKSIQFTINPKPGSVTRPVSATYANSYLLDRGFENPQTGEVVLPVYGLYDGYNNTVALTYRFMDGSSKRANLRITTATFDDPCGYKNPTILKARTNNTDLSYDYMMVKGSCSNFAPAIVDTDGALRWVGTAGISIGSATFFDNAAYLGHGRKLSRIDLDGTVTELADYSGLGVITFHHNIDRGKVGIILDANTTTQYNSVNIEVDASGRVLKTWNMAHIISAAMIAGGDDPSQFVYPTPTDWFHNNGVTYNRADDSVIVSSRENFLICLDYNTGAIKWILGDPTKKWYQFPSLRKFALALAPGSLPPIGQHTPSITYDQNLLMLDNGQFSVFNVPRGDQRGYASPRKYEIDLNAKIATEVWNFEAGQNMVCPYCASVYEDAPLNYLIDYAFESPSGQNAFARLLGLNGAGETIFSYRYPTFSCTKAYRAFPVHLENTNFPTVGPQALNLSTRGLISSGDNVLIGGFIVSGTEPKTVVLRALGPSLSGFGLSNVLRDPVLRVYNSSHTLIATNDNWQADPNHFVVESNGLVPANVSESAMARSLAPGAYTVIVTGKDPTPGIGLVELYDLSPLSDSKLKNISTRGSVGTLDNVLISGFIVGDVDSATVIVRATGPSLTSHGVSGVLSDPTLEIYDSTGSVIASNDNWLDNVNWVDIRKNALSPTDERESALVLHLPAGKYTAIVRGANGATGNALVEVYGLD
jgi:arylsulfate sulfotransferase